MPHPANRKPGRNRRHRLTEQRISLSRDAQQTECCLDELGPAERGQDAGSSNRLRLRRVRIYERLRADAASSAVQLALRRGHPQTLVHGAAFNVIPMPPRSLRFADKRKEPKNAPTGAFDQSRHIRCLQSMH